MKDSKLEFVATVAHHLRIYFSNMICSLTKQQRLMVSTDMVFSNVALQHKFIGRNLPGFGH